MGTESPDAGGALRSRELALGWVEGAGGPGAGIRSYSSSKGAGAGLLVNLGSHGSLSFPTFPPNLILLIDDSSEFDILQNFEFLKITAINAKYH